ncbi:5'-AMP-activated protein kinase subunit beta-1-like isoform X1 [Centruroides sculpturatus]|uniref:5'-AMP-activated protein kinase subunit beta-1-like isoform X1 n=1 Tax=Centruroides sculpturatus TaxID=218467 RepID=UPI000C6DDB96|nr:5'-AMP-activated protein kinase subunit beta-1-like isoform X1 [Centruroides sculpturatus]
MGNGPSHTNKCLFNSKRSGNSRKINIKRNMVKTEPIHIPCALRTKNEFSPCNNSSKGSPFSDENYFCSPVRYKTASQRILQRFVRFSPSKLEEDKRNKEEELRHRCCTLTPCMTISESSLPIVFRWCQGGNRVFVACSFNEWKLVEMAKSDDCFMTILNMPEGEYRYRFLVDGIWKYDDKQPLTVKENFNYNVLTVKYDDFEIFDALNVHNQDVGSPLKYSPPSPSEYFNQEIPRERISSGPPALPPHLSQIILNVDAEQKETSILPQPSHFMLNHLYTLSIQEDIIVLGVIQRFRTKYVTTIFYTPFND